MLDFTSFWAFFKKNDNRLSTIITLGIVFAAGWYLGHITSPYSNTTPIVFNDRECSACSGSGGSVAELEALRAEGAPQVAGAAAPAAANQGAVFVSSVNSDLYHHFSCPSASRIKQENQEWFATSEEARTAGLEPSKCTQELGL